MRKRLFRKRDLNILTSTFRTIPKRESSAEDSPGLLQGKKLQCAKGFFWLICQRSPVWVTPIVTANIIDIATNPGKNSIQRILFNLVIALLFISQNAFSNYMATKHFSGANRD